MSGNHCWWVSVFVYMCVWVWVGVLPCLFNIHCPYCAPPAAGPVGRLAEPLMLVIDHLYIF